MLYFLALIAEFVYHDITYDERMSDYFAIRDSNETFASDHDRIKASLFGVEFGIIIFFLINFVLHFIGYGCLFASKPQTIFISLLLLGNICLLGIFASDR